MGGINCINHKETLRWFIIVLPTFSQIAIECGQMIIHGNSGHYGHSLIFTKACRTHADAGFFTWHRDEYRLNWRNAKLRWNLRTGNWAQLNSCWSKPHIHSTSLVRHPCCFLLNRREKGQGDVQYQCLHPFLLWSSMIYVYIYIIIIWYDPSWSIII